MLYFISNETFGGAKLSKILTDIFNTSNIKIRPFIQILWLFGLYLPSFQKASIWPLSEKKVIWATPSYFLIWAIWALKNSNWTIITGDIGSASNRPLFDLSAKKVIELTPFHFVFQLLTFPDLPLTFTWKMLEGGREITKSEKRGYKGSKSKNRFWYHTLHI